MKFLRIPLIVLALVGLIALAGCGGDDDSTTSDEASSSEEYATQVQEVLLSFGSSFQALGTEISAAKDPDEFASLVDEAEGEIQTAIDDFSAITPPEEAQEAHDQILAALEDFSSKLTDVSDAAASGDKASLQSAASELQAAGLDFQQQLTEAGEKLTEAGVGVGESTTG